MNTDRFSRWEEQIEQLVEGSFARLFGSHLHPRELAIKLARAVEDNAWDSEDNQLFAPNAFLVTLNPIDLDAIMIEHPELDGLLADTVVELAHRAGLRLDNVPLVRLQADAALSLHDAHITAHYASDEMRATQVLRLLEAPLPVVTPTPRNPQLIVSGHHVCTLERSVVNVGRKRDNHVVIDDPRVSRMHAQLRLRFGRYVLYDLGSRGGTYVNNHRVTEHILRPGDVISLAGVTLVYMEDESTSGSVLSDTQMRPPIAKARPDDSDPTV